jgi:hypothetical protein
MRKLAIAIALLTCLGGVAALTAAGATKPRPAGDRSQPPMVVQGLEASIGADGTPPCSPYTAETPSQVCALKGLHYDLLAVGTRACEFQKSNWSCEGWADGGPYPWGAAPQGGRAWTFFNWAPREGGGRSVVIISQGSKDAKPDLVRMEGHMSGPGSADLMIDRAVVKTDTGTAEFFTPNLPGQKAGEPGGPLYLNFVNGRGLGADAWIDGYLYVKR